MTGLERSNRKSAMEKILGLWGSASRSVILLLRPVTGEAWSLTVAVK